jgi:hypothetical protein
MRFADLMLQSEDTCLHELVRGEILRLPLPKGQHGVIEARLVESIDRYLYRQAIAPSSGILNSSPHPGGEAG